MDITLRDVRRDLARRERRDPEKPWDVTKIPDGYELGDVIVTVDIDGLAKYLARRAMENRTGRARLGYGTAKVTKRKRYQEHDKELLEQASKDNKVLNLMLHEWVGKR